MSDFLCHVDGAGVKVNVTILILS